MSGVSIRLEQASTRTPLSMAAPTRHVMTTTMGTTTRRCSAPGATRRTNRWRWKRCGKQCVSCRGLFTGPKGWSTRSDAPQRRAVLQVVGRRVDISLQDEWGQRAPRTQIIAIGAAGSIDASLLEKTFASCISAQP